MASRLQTPFVPDQHVSSNGDRPRLSLGVAAARNLVSTTKSAPQTPSISPRWLMRALPWLPVQGGVYRVNRRLTYSVGDGRLTFTSAGGRFEVVPGELREIPFLREFGNSETLNRLAGRFEQKTFQAGDAIVTQGQPADQIVLIAHGKVNKLGSGPYGEETLLDVWVDGDYFGYDPFAEEGQTWAFTARATTSCTVLMLSATKFKRFRSRSESLQAHLQEYGSRPAPPRNKHGEAAISLAAGHEGEADLPGTFVDYDPQPREYHLSPTQTVLRIHTRVADLYNQPLDQTEEQLRLTIEAIRERQEHELVNNPDFGLLPNADLSQRVPTRTGPPTPDDLDELLTRRRKNRFLVAHPRAIAAFGRQCTRRGVYPDAVEVEGGSLVMGWRGLPIYPCDKIPITSSGTTSILAIRTGEQDEGVVALRPASIPDEHEPGLSVRFMAINEKAIASYLITAYCSAAILVPDALGVLEEVEIYR